MVNKIMIVDDDPDIVLIVKQGLERIDEDYEVICINSGLACLEALKNDQIPDILLLDIMMPGMDGWQLLNRLIDNYEWGKIPIVFLTAKTDSFSKTFGSSVSIDFIEKPFSIEDLDKRIKNILNKIKAQKTDHGSMI